MQSSHEDRARDVALLEAVRLWYRAGSSGALAEVTAIDLAVRHGLGGLLPWVPDAASQVSRHRTMMALTTAITGGLRGAHLPHAVLRGPVTAAMYPYPENRRCADLDLLVGFCDRDRDRDRVRAVMAGLGLHQGTVLSGTVRPPTVHELALEVREKRMHAFIATRPGDSGHVVVEVHHRFRAPFEAESRELDPATLARTVVVRDRITGSDIPALHPADRVVELAAHVEAKTTHLPALRAGRDLRIGLYLDLALALRETRIEDVLVHAGPEAKLVCRAIDRCLAIMAGPSGKHAAIRQPIRHFTTDGTYRVVAELEADFDTRFAAGSSLPFLRWLVREKDLDDAAVLHPHGEVSTHERQHQQADPVRRRAPGDAGPAHATSHRGTDM